jgi:ATP-binding cassette subfamily B protein
MYSMKNFIADIWVSVEVYKRKFWLATCLRAISDIAGLYLPYALAVIVNFFSTYSQGQSIAPLYSIFLLMVITTLVRQLGMYLAKSIMYNISEKIVLDTQLHAMKHMTLLDMSWHEKENTGSKFKRIDRGAASINTILRIWIVNIIEIAVNLVGIIFIIFKFDTAMAVAVSIFLITYYFIAHFYRKRAVQAANVVNSKEEYRSGILFESINNIRSIKVMSMSAKIFDIIAVNAADILKSTQKRIYWFQFGNSIRNLYANIFQIGATAFIVYSITEGRYQIGFLVLFTGYFSNVWKSMSELTDVAQDIAIAKNAIERMKRILDTPVMIDDESGKVCFPNEWKRIAIRDVAFSYQDTSVLRGISFEIKRGEKVGIIGLSGAGKSTLFKLLSKEHESYSGEIAFDGVNLKDISKQDYFHYVAVVLQETELFNRSLRENITMTNQKEDHNEELLETTLTVASVKDFMRKLPDGVNTMIGEKGVKLSGGEKQRVGIARAIFKQPQIVLLDEATSHLDIESEEKIQNSLHLFFKSVTAIVIAHRLTTIKEMDKIIVIEDGQVLESGSFDELYSAKGRFFDLWEKQKL